MNVWFNIAHPMGRQGAQCLDSADSTKVSLIYTVAGGEP